MLLNPVVALVLEVACMAAQFANQWVLAALKMSVVLLLLLLLLLLLPAESPLYIFVYQTSIHFQI
jgi:hypothetical protein